jgi:hypothetical protein
VNEIEGTTTMAVELPTRMTSLDTLSPDFEATRQEQIQQLVASRIRGRIRELQISVRGDTLVISGRATTYYSKQLATHAVLDVSDARVIQNDVVVGAAD